MVKETYRIEVYGDDGNLSLVYAEATAFALQESWLRITMDKVYFLNTNKIGRFSVKKI